MKIWALEDYGMYRFNDDLKGEPFGGVLLDSANVSYCVLSVIHPHGEATRLVVR